MIKKTCGNCNNGHEGVCDINNSEIGETMPACEKWKFRRLTWCKTCNGNGYISCHICPDCGGWTSVYRFPRLHKHGLSASGGAEKYSPSIKTVIKMWWLCWKHRKI